MIFNEVAKRTPYTDIAYCRAYHRHAHNTYSTFYRNESNCGVSLSLCRFTAAEIIHFTIQNAWALIEDYWHFKWPVGYRKWVFYGKQGWLGRSSCVGLLCSHSRFYAMIITKSIDFVEWIGNVISTTAHSLCMHFQFWAVGRSNAQQWACASNGNVAFCLSFNKTIINVSFVSNLNRKTDLC